MAFTLFNKLLSKKAKVPAGYNPIDSNTLKGYNKFRPNGAQPFFCYVPFTSLTFSFSGQVFACSYNRRVLLGRYPKNSIRAIWDGEEANKLRDHMRYNDLNYGCEHCKYFADKGKFSNLKPLVFDQYAKKYQEGYPLVMEFELSNTCNLECQMCTGEVSSSIRKNRDKLPPIQSPYDDEFIEQLKEFIPYLEEAKFYGGEPFLIPAYFKIWKIIHDLKPDMRLFVITNGTTWNEKVEKVLESGLFEVAVSIDALDKEKVEKIRKNVKLEDLLENIGKFNAYCRKNGRHLSLSFTVQKENWDELPKMIEYCNSIEAYIFISYLETPIHFSIADMSVEELEDIRQKLGMFTFSVNRPYEISNNRCYTDFLHYIETHIADARSKTYTEYRYGYLEKREEAGHPKKFKQIENPQRIWKARLGEYHKTNRRAVELFNYEAVVVRIDSLRVSLSEENQEKFDLLLANEVPDIWVNHVLRTEDEELIGQINHVLGTVNVIK